MHHNQKCRELFEKLSEYIDNELESGDCDAIEAHLQQCPPCQACLMTLKQTVALCHELKTASSNPDIPEAASGKLRAMIEKMIENVP